MAFLMKFGWEDQTAEPKEFGNGWADLKMGNNFGSRLKKWSSVQIWVIVLGLGPKGSPGWAWAKNRVSILGLAWARKRICWYPPKAHQGW